MGLSIAYLVIGMWVHIATTLHGDTVIFVRASRQLLGGSFDLYSFLFVPESAPPLGTGYSYSPLLAMLLAPFVAVADRLSPGDGSAEKLIVLPLLVIDLLAMQQLLHLVRRWRPFVDERFLFLGIAMTLFLTSFFAVTALRGHHEGLVLLFLLLMLRFISTNLLLSGLFAGLALAAKQTALFELIPVGFVLLAGGFTSREVTQGSMAPAPAPARRRSGLLDACAWTGTALAVFGLFVLPAFVANAASAQYGLFTVMSRLALYGPGLPGWIDRAMQGLLDTNSYLRAHDFIIQYANLALVGVVTLVSALTVWRERKQGRPMTLLDSRLLGLLAFAGLVQIVLGKRVGGHYYQLPLALVLLWDVVRTGGRRPETAQDRATIATSFPAIGLGAAIAFRSVAQLDTGMSKDTLILLLFVVLSIIVLYNLREEPGMRPTTRQ